MLWSYHHHVPSLVGPISAKRYDRFCIWIKVSLGVWEGCRQITVCLSCVSLWCFEAHRDSTQTSGYGFVCLLKSCNLAILHCSITITLALLSPLCMYFHYMKGWQADKWDCKWVQHNAAHANWFSWFVILPGNCNKILAVAQIWLFGIAVTT